MDPAPRLGLFWISFLEEWRKHLLRLVGSKRGLNPAPFGHRDQARPKIWKDSPREKRPPPSRARSPVAPGSRILNPDEVKSRLMARK